MTKAAAGQAKAGFDRIAAVCAALVIVSLVVFLLIRNEESADARLFFALRLVLSVGAAMLGATIPGFLSVGWSGGGLTVRAGGALALFVLSHAAMSGVKTSQAGNRRVVRAGSAAHYTVAASPRRACP